MKILTVVGARPQFIKAAVLSRKIAEYNIHNSELSIQEIIVHTEQHYDRNMSLIFFDELQIPKPHYFLSVKSGSHGEQTGRMLEKIETVLLKEQPNWVLVYGDTNSTLAGALAAVKLNMPVAHVEAGLRSFNRRMPEEINRILTDHASELLFAPTETSQKNLRNEGIVQDKISLVGDVMCDAMLYYGEKAEKESNILQQLNLQNKGYILATIHRAENTDDSLRLAAIFKGLARVGREIPIVLPLHPRTRNVLNKIDLSNDTHDYIRLIDPVGYLDMVLLEKNARLIVTDSGGVQKEAFFYRVPCVTLRNETEWVELLDMGWNYLVPPISAEHVVCGVYKRLDYMGFEGSPYGKGNTAQLIVNKILES